MLEQAFNPEREGAIRRVHWEDVEDGTADEQPEEYTKFSSQRSDFCGAEASQVICSRVATQHLFMWFLHPGHWRVGLEYCRRRGSCNGDSAAS